MVYFSILFRSFSINQPLNEILKKILKSVIQVCVFQVKVVAYNLPYNFYFFFSLNQPHDDFLRNTTKPENLIFP